MFGNGAGIGLEFIVLLNRPILTVLRGPLAGWGGVIRGSRYTAISHTPPTPLPTTPEEPMDKAYKNIDFMNSREARSVRILSEYLEPQARFARYNVTDTVVFFGSGPDYTFGEAYLVALDLLTGLEVWSELLSSSVDMNMATAPVAISIISRVMFDWRTLL